MDMLTVVIICAGVLAAAFVLGGIFGASVYHFARKQAEKVAKAVSDAANKGAAAVDKTAADISAAASKL